MLVRGQSEDCLEAVINLKNLPTLDIICWMCYCHIACQYGANQEAWLLVSRGEFIIEKINKTLTPDIALLVVMKTLTMRQPSFLSGDMKT